MNDRKNILYLLGIAVLVLIVVTFSLQLHLNYSTQPFITWPDAVSYRNAAKLLYTQAFSANPIRPFGYPLVIGLPLLFGPASDLTVFRFAIVLNVLFWLLSIIVLYATIARIASRRAAFVGSVLFITCISHVAGLYQSLSETFFLLVVLTAFYYLLRYIQQRRNAHALLFIGLLCFSVVVRPISLYFALLAAATGIIMFLFRRQWRNALLTIALVVVTIGLQSFNMHRKFNSYTQSYIQNYTLYTYLMSGAEYAQYKGAPITFGVFYERRMATTDSILGKYPFGSVEYLHYADDHYKAHIKANFATNKANVIKCMLSNMVHNVRTGSGMVASVQNYSGSSLFAPAQKLFNKLTFWQNVLLSLSLVICQFWLLFIVLLRRSRHGAALLFIVPLSLFATYLFATSGVSFWQADRFTFILFPFTIIILAYLLAGHRRSLSQNSDASHQ